MRAGRARLPALRRLRGRLPGGRGLHAGGLRGELPLQRDALRRRLHGHAERPRELRDVRERLRAGSALLGGDVRAELRGGLPDVRIGPFGLLRGDDERPAELRGVQRGLPGWGVLRERELPGELRGGAGDALRGAVRKHA